MSTNTNPQVSGTAPAPVDTTVVTLAAPAAPVTLDSYISAAPAELREVLQSGVKVLADQKNGFIKAILATNRSPYSEDELKLKSLDELKKLAAFATVPVETTTDYSGLGAPRLVDNSAAENYTPAPSIWGTTPAA